MLKMNVLEIKFLLAFSTIIYVCIASVDNQEIRSRKFEPISTELITSEMCEEDEFKRLHICTALKKNKPKLKKAVEEYSCLFNHLNYLSPSNSTHYTTEIIQSHHGGSHNSSTVFSMTSQSTSNTSTSSMISTSQTKVSMSSSSSHRISKRSSSNAATNPCSGTQKLVVIYEAKEKDSDTFYELVHDTESHLYQTFYLEKNCPTSTSVSGCGMKCAQFDIIFKTLVYLHPPGVSDEVGTKNIRAPGTCGVSFD